MAHYVFYYIPINPPRYCDFSYPKYWTKIHFNQDVDFYCTQSYSLYVDKVTMREEIHSWFPGLGYKEWLDTDEHEQSKKAEYVLPPGRFPREVNHFIKTPDIFSSRLPRTPEEDYVIVLTLDLPFIQNHLEGDKMEIGYELTHSMFKVAFIFSLVSAKRGDALAPGSSFKDMDVWKGKDEPMEMK
ncbi:unnamed protein product [Vicia faba]|uniref:Uncharacterized protein n=1 Tax=Vicia faba TaxID=3906 RepID=A0AAV1AHJ0_VICFA|nr:unnamed protein product [Vicia faba]